MSAQPLQLPQFNLGDRVAWMENGVEHKGRYIGSDPRHPEFARVDPDDKRLLRDGENSVLVHPSQLRLVASARVLEFKPTQPKTEPAPKAEPAPVKVEQPKPEQPKPAPVNQSTIVGPDANGGFPTPADGAIWMLVTYGIPQTVLHGKVPFLPGWQQPENLLTSSEAIRRAAEKDPGCNFGSVFNKKFLACEIDTPPEGVKGMAARYREFSGEPFASQLRIRSSENRGHLYYLWTEGVENISQSSATKYGDFSLRVLGEQCVSPGSIHPITREQYRVASHGPLAQPNAKEIAFWNSEKKSSKTQPPPTAPVLAPVSAPAPGAKPTPDLRIDIDPELVIPSGTRDNTLASIAGALRFHSDNRLSCDELDYILGCVNNHCVPPLKEADVKRIAKSISREEYAAIREKHGVVIGGKFLDSREGMVVVGLRITKDAKVEEIREIDPAVAQAPGQTTADIAAANAAAAAEALWNSPKLDLNNQLVEVQKFELDFLPASLRPRVADVSKRTSTPLDFAGVASILCLSGATGRRAFVHPKGQDKEWRVAIALSGFVVAPSGDIKTPVWDAFLAPLIENDAQWREAYKEAKKRYDEETEEWEQSKKRKKGEQPELNPKPKPTPPKQRNSVINNATPEALHSAMEDNPEGYSYHRDELSGFIEELDQEGREAQRDIFMKAMDGNSSYTMKRIGRGEVSAIMCASVSGNFQPNRLAALLNNTRNIEDGFVPRNTLMVYPERIHKQVVDCPVDQKAKEVYRYIARELVAMHAEEIEMHFTPEAQPVFDLWLEENTKRGDEEPSEWIRSHLSKYNGALPKLAGLFQMVDIIAAEGAACGYDGGKRRQKAKQDDTLRAIGLPTIIREQQLIDVEHLNQAIRLLAYLETHMRKIYGTVKSPLAKAEEALASHIKEGSLRSDFTVRDVIRKGWKGLKVQALVEEAIQTLEDAGWIRRTIVKTGGRPQNAWEINPKVW